MDKAIPCCLCNVLLKVIDGKEFTSFDLSLVHPRHEEGVWLNVSEVLASRFLLFNQAVAIRRKVFEKVGGFDETLKYLEDYDLPLRLSFEGPWALIRDPLVMYGKDSPLSFSQAALRDPIVLKQCELQICNRMLTIARGGNEQVRFRRQLHRRMRIFHRELKAIELGRKRFWGAQIISRLLMRGEHYVRVGFRRSPWFPKVVTVPLGKRRYVTDKS
jgi:hypothetical protein